MDNLISQTTSDLSFGLFSFRPAQPENTEALARLLRESGNGLYEYLFANQPEKNLDQWLEACIHLRSSPYHFMNWRVCQLDGKIIGGLCLIPELLLGFSGLPIELDDTRKAIADGFHAVGDANSYHIPALSVHELYWRVGIGTTLVSWAAAEAKSQGYQSLSLFSATTNVSTLSFYERQGFHIVHTTPDVPAAPIAPYHYLAKPL